MRDSDQQEHAAAIGESAQVSGARAQRRQADGLSENAAHKNRDQSRALFASLIASTNTEIPILTGIGPCSSNTPRPAAVTCFLLGRRPLAPLCLVCQRLTDSQLWGCGVSSPRRPLWTGRIPCKGEELTTEIKPATLRAASVPDVRLSCVSGSSQGSPPNAMPSLTLRGRVPRAATTWLASEGSTSQVVVAARDPASGNGRMRRSSNKPAVEEQSTQNEARYLKKREEAFNLPIRNVPEGSGLEELLRLAVSWPRAPHLHPGNH